MEWRHTVWPQVEMVYTAIAKVANTSVKSALLESFAPEQSRRNPHANDLDYTTVRPGRIGQEYPTYLHFAVSRNPFDRLVSFWADKIDGEGMTRGIEELGFKKKMPFAEAAAIACSLPDDHTDPHIRSQTFLLANEKGRLAVDLLLRFERLNEDWDMLCRLATAKTGASMKPLPRRRISEHKRFIDYYDSATIDLVAQRYAMDFDLLGYAQDPGVSPAGPQSDRSEHVTRAIVAAAHGGGVLDLADKSLTRALVVESRGGFYVAHAPTNPFGQLCRFTSLEANRLPQTAFEALVVRRADLQGRQPHTWLHEEFTRSARPVFVVD